MGVSQIHPRPDFVSMVKAEAKVPDSLPTKEATSSQRLEDAFALFQSELLGALYYLTGSREDAQDAVQEAFIKCWKNIEQVEQVRNLRAWIFRIALNTGRDIRQTAWRRKRQGLPEEEQMVVSSAAGPLAQVLRSERESQLREALWQLRDEEKEVFLLRQNGDMTYEEIGEALELPTGTVKTRMRRALQRIREALGHD
jgi:RNA polymerase sigma-70 factor (ECF subfamily)